MPSSPSATAWTAAVFVTMVKTSSHRSAASRGLCAQRAPASSSGAALSRVRFQTLTSCPAASRRRTIDLPITPRPTNPRSAMCDSLSNVALDAVEVQPHLITSPARVAGGDGGADRAVLEDRALGAVGDVIDGRERAPQHVPDGVHRVGD